jgi:hypothetical protein
VHDAEAESEVEQVPLVPGYEPPLKEYGAAKPFALNDVAATPPLLVIVNVLSVEDPVAFVP